MIYTAPVRNVFFWGARTLRGGCALEILTFLGPKWHSPIGSCPFRAQKSLDFQGPPS